MVFYNQNDYEHVPYPCEAEPEAEIKSSGCGVCSACMIVENMTEHKLSVEECARLSLSVGGRDNDGTDMQKLGPVIAERYGLTYAETDNPKKALEHLNGGHGMIIANPGGDREGHVGLFTTTGHYIVLAEARGRTVRVLDPNLKPDSFDREGRKGYVFVDGTNIYCDIAVVAEDCLNRDPAFYLFGWK